MIPPGRVWLRGEIICQVQDYPDETGQQGVKTQVRGSRRGGWCETDAARVELWWENRDEWGPQVQDSPQLSLFPGVRP